MLKYLFSLLLLVGVVLFASGQIEYKYQSNNPDLPQWVKMMYAENPNVKNVMAAYAEYYETHEFKKNSLTQYYKRWLRGQLPYLNREGFAEKPDPKTEQRIKEAYLQNLAKHRAAKVNAANWEELGPWEYDHETTMNVSVQSPGSSHVYTVEQAASNPDIIYAGTASAGIWKSTDKGENWDRVGADLLLNQVYSIEIDHTDPNTLYFAGGERIWKSTNGGASFTETGSSQYFDWVRDLRMLPGNNQILLAATNQGFYRTIDAGATWSQVAGGEYMEIEFHPTTPSTVYTVKLNGNRTEFYKSLDGGETFSIRTNGWPGVATTQSAPNFNAVSLGASGDFVAANTVALGTASIPDFTIEMRVKSNGWSGDPALISNKNWDSGVNRGFILAGRGNGGWKFNIGDDTNRIDINGGTINDNQWHQIVITYEANGTKNLYQDGGLVGTSTNVISLNAQDPALSLGIGQDGRLTYGEFFDGTISEVRIWNKALTQTAVADWQCLSVDNTHPDYASLIHYWKLEEGTGTLAADPIGSNDGTLNGSSSWSTANNMTCIESEMTGAEEQRRVEMSVSAAAPENIYILATGDMNGGSGLYGFYKSTDGGETFTHTCCGTGPGGPASITNKNIVGYSNTGEADGGQYYYDLALGVSPTDPDRIFPAGISVNRSEDGGVSFETNAHWVTWVGDNTKKRYTHADVHDVKFFQNGPAVDMWVASDGGLYYSSDQGDSISPRMYGIQGTEFWGFGSSYKDDAMVGGTYHNGTLLSYKKMFPKGKNGHGGWLASGAGDATRGYVHPSESSIFFEDGGMWQVQGAGMNWKRLSFDNSKRPNASAQPGLYGNYEWDPRNYNTFYSPSGSAIWRTENNGSSFTLVHDFGVGLVYSMKISRDNPDVIYVVHNDEPASTVRIWKTTDAGQNWIDITPADAQVNNLNYKNKTIEIDQANANHLWFIITGWYGHTGNKVFESTDGGTTWTDLTGTILENERAYDISHHQGSDGGIYIGTNRAVFYKNNSMPDWQLYNDGLPASTFAGYLYPNYTKQKIRVGTRSGVYQSDLFENAPPLAKPSADKTEVNCLRDTVYFKELSYVSGDNVSFQWQFPGGTPSSSIEANPKVVYGAEGVFSVQLTVTDNYGTDTHEFVDMITVENHCSADTIPGNTLLLTNDGDFAEVPSLDMRTNEMTISAWVKPDGIQADYTGIVFNDSGDAAGLNVRPNNELAYHWPGGQWWWSSGLIVPEGEWSHVALVVSPDSISVFLNGIRSTHFISPDSVDFNELFIGRYQNRNDRCWKGQIDEVAVWNKSLTQEDIREWRHLTKKPQEDPALLAYFQFNQASGEVLDKVGIRHAKLNGAATRMLSSAPVGGGASARLSVNSGGEKLFLGTGIGLQFPSTGTYPDGEIVATRINLAPDQLPVTQQYSRSYWVINNYGTKATFTDLERISFDKIGNVTASGVTTPATFKLYKRASNAEGATWATSIDDGDVAVAGADGDVTFSTGNGISTFSQFIITNEGGNSLPVELLSFTAAKEGKNVRLKWQTAAEVNVAHFVIQRSKSSDFSDLMTVKARGGAFLTAYAHLDEAPLPGTSYYRLMIVDRDGAISYSPIVTIDFWAENQEIAVYPNPVKQGRSFFVESSLKEELLVTLYDVAGREIFQETVFEKGVVNLESMAAGVYMCNIKGKTFMRNIRLLVQ